MRRTVEDATREYNRYRSLEAKARMAFAKDDRLKVEFTGSFCFTCGYCGFSLEGAARIRCRD